MHINYFNSINIEILSHNVIIFHSILLLLLFLIIKNADMVGIRDFFQKHKLPSFLINNVSVFTECDALVWT